MDVKNIRWKEKDNNKMMPDSKSIVDRLNAAENQIAKLNQDVTELKAVICHMKEHDSMLVH
jgi:hypothetical protein